MLTAKSLPLVPRPPVGAPSGEASSDGELLTGQRRSSPTTFRCLRRLRKSGAVYREADRLPPSPAQRVAQSSAMDTHGAMI
jgi:hypothetical protein